MKNNACIILRKIKVRYFFTCHGLMMVKTSCNLIKYNLFLKLMVTKTIIGLWEFLSFKVFMVKQITMNKSNKLNVLRYIKDKHGLITQEGHFINRAYFQDLFLIKK